MAFASPVADKGKRKEYRYERIPDNAGEWKDRAQVIIEENKDRLYDYERTFEGLVKLFLTHGATCLEAIDKLPGRPGAATTA